MCSPENLCGSVKVTGFVEPQLSESWSSLRDNVYDVEISNPSLNKMYKKVNPGLVRIELIYFLKGWEPKVIVRKS